MKNWEELADMFRGCPNKHALRILPNREMTLDGLEKARVEAGADKVVCFDFNPIGIATMKDLNMARRKYPNLMVVDHHGASHRTMPIGQEETTVSIMISELARPFSRLAGWILDGLKILFVTNEANLDPDGFLAYLIARNPGLALAHAPWLISMAHFDDYTTFGGVKIRPGWTGDDAPTRVKMGWELLERINKQKQLHLQRTIEGIVNPDRDRIRSVFTDPTTYNPRVVAEMFDNLANEAIDIIVNRKKILAAPDAGWRSFLQRLHVINAKIVASTTRDELISYVDYHERPDYPEYKITDWLACSIPAPDAPEIPLMVQVSRRTGQIILSVPYSTQRDHPKRFDLCPVIDEANKIEIAQGTGVAWYGRGSVVLRTDPANATKYAVRGPVLRELTKRLYAAGKITGPRVA